MRHKLTLDDNLLSDMQCTPQLRRLTLAIQHKKIIAL